MKICIYNYRLISLTHQLLLSLYSRFGHSFATTATNNYCDCKDNGFTRPLSFRLSLHTSVDNGGHRN
jgi:hypothetical protein